MDIRKHRRTGKDSPEKLVFPSTQETHDRYFFLQVVFFQTQPIYSFYFGVPIWPLFLLWFPISLYYNYALYCKCKVPPILTFGMFTSDRVFPRAPCNPCTTCAKYYKMLKDLQIHICVQTFRKIKYLKHMLVIVLLPHMSSSLWYVINFLVMDLLCTNCD